MKSFFLTVGLLIIYQLSISQSNNPYNQNGLDYVASLELIQNDYNQGQVREFNEQTISHYSSAIPLQNQVSMSLVTTIINTRNSTNSNIDSVIDATSLSSFSKNTSKSIYKSSIKLSLEKYKEFLIALVDDINNSSISQNEKKLLLTFTAIAYQTASSTSLGRRGCIITANGESNTAEGFPCIVVGAIIGGYIGWEICGFWCALGGAVVGGILGSLS